MEELNKKNFIKDILKFSAGQWGSAVFSFITAPIISWMIMPDEFGKSSMFTLAFNLIRLVVIAGIDQSFVRQFYEKEEKDRASLLWNSLFIPIILSLIFIIISLLFWKEISYLLFENNDEFYPVLILSLSVFISVMERYATLIIRMKKRGWAFSVLTFSNKAVDVGVILLYSMLISKTFYAFVTGAIACYTATFLIALYLEKDFWKFSLKINLKELKSLAAFGLPLLPASIIFWLLQSVGRISLRSYCTFNELGIYQTAFKIVTVLQLIQAGFNVFWAPVSYENYQKNPGKKLLYQKTASSLSAIMFLFGLLLILSNKLIFLLFSPSYRTASPIVPFLLLSPIMLIVSEVTVVGINFTKKTSWHLLVVIIAAIVTFIGNWKLVPLFGAKGAAIATGMSYIVFFYMRTIISKKLYPADYDLYRFSISTCIFIIVAFINTFSDDMAVNLTSAGAGVLFTAFLYKNQIKDLLNIGKDLLGDAVLKFTKNNKHIG